MHFSWMRWHGMFKKELEILTGRTHYFGSIRLARPIFSWAYCRDPIWGWGIGRTWISKFGHKGFTPGFRVSFGRLNLTLDLDAFAWDVVK